MRMTAFALLFVAPLTACGGGYLDRTYGPGGSGFGGMGGKETAGTLLGAAGGGLLGSQFGKGKGKIAMTALGVLAGAGIGNSIGASLDRSDRFHIERTNHVALESALAGQAVHWRNPDSGNAGSVVPGRVFQALGAHCREFQQTVVVGGQPQQAYGTACRTPDGSWRLVQP